MGEVDNKRKRGRPVGSRSNHKTPKKDAHDKLRKLLTEFSINNFNEFKSSYEFLLKTSPKDACKVYVDIMKFVTPQIQATALEVNDITDNKSYKDRIIEMRDSMKNNP